jgi:uncharacterized membrane protein YhaH (DUF805 family)
MDSLFECSGSGSCLDLLSCFEGGRATNRSDLAAVRLQGPHQPRAILDGPRDLSRRPAGFAHPFVPIQLLLFVIFFAGLVVSLLMVVIKRLHDRNKGDWWAILFFIVPIALNGRINDWSLGGQLGETADGIFHLVATAISIWAFIELGCLRGTRGTNAYGPDPLGVRPKQEQRSRVFR